MLISYTLVCSECILLIYSRNFPAAPAYGLNFFHASTEVMESSGFNGRNANLAGSNISTAPSTHITQAIPFKDSLSEEQINVFHKILDCVSETAAAEMRAAYKVGFKDGANMMKEIQD